LRDLLASDYTPKNRSSKDKLTYCKYHVSDTCIDSVVVNAALLLTYSLLTSFIFSPWYVGFTVGVWLGIIELTIIIFIKYYQTFY
jgi:hypothetical protein